jgi:hypothetical protein
MKDLPVMVAYKTNSEKVLVRRIVSLRFYESIKLIGIGVQSKIL